MITTSWLFPVDEEVREQGMETISGFARGRTLVTSGTTLAVMIAVTAMATAGPAGAEPVAGAELFIDGASVTADGSCSLAALPADDEFCWDGGTLLILNDVSVNSIRAAEVDLTVHAVGINEIAAVGQDGIAVFNGDLAIVGESGARVEIGTTDQTMLAISMAPVATPGHLTVGSESGSVTVRVRAGQSVPSPEVTLVGTSVYDYVVPGPGDPGPGDPGDPGPPPGPPPGAPGTLSVGGVVLVDEGARTANEVPGVTVDYMFIPPMVEFWTVSFEGSADPASPSVFGPVELEGSQSFFVNASGYVSVQANGNGLSFDAGSEHGNFAFMGPDSGEAVFLLEGGIASDEVNLDGAIRVQVGSAATPSAVGVTVDRGVNVYNPGRTGAAVLEVFTASGVPAISVSPSSPGAQVQADSNGVLRIDAGGAAFSGFGAGDVRVASGGEIDATFGTVLGVPYGVSSVWPMQNVGCIEFDAPMVEPTRVPADVAGDFSDDPDKRYQLETGASFYHLTSTAPGLVSFSWEEGWDSTNPVTGGQVCVLASRGWATVDQGVYFGFMIEEGSEVTLLLLPEYQHQFVSGEFEYLGPPEIGGGSVPVDPIVSNSAQYTFVMPELNIELSAVFEEVPDPAADLAGTDTVISASVQVPPADINGNAQLEIDDLGTPTNASEFVAAAGGRTIGGYLDVSVEQQIQQGDTGGFWVEDVNTLSEPATVVLELDDDLAGYTDYMVIHDDGDSVSTVPATYDAATGTLTFQTPGFSPFAIAHGAARSSLPATGTDDRQILALGGLAVLLVGTGIMALRTRRRLG